MQKMKKAMLKKVVSARKFAAVKAIDPTSWVGCY